MKKAITLCAMLSMATFALAQGDSTLHHSVDLQPNFTTEVVPGDGISITASGTFITITGAGFDCVPFTRFTDWQANFQGDSTCTHAWVYAEEQDVNEVAKPYITLEYRECPCGCSSQTSEARICERCFRGEFRVRFEGFDIVMREESAYSRLRKKAPKN